MRRFYNAAAVETRDNGHAIVLDGRPVRTPGRNPLQLPTRQLADAIAAEWEAQAETIEPATMPLTQLASTALDRIAPQPAAVAAQVARYAETDLVCYRADHPETLVQRQHALWSPLLRWLQASYAAKLVVTEGIRPIPQPAAAIAAVQKALAAFPTFKLAAISSVTGATGSVVIALALADGEITSDQAAEAAFVDERYQMEIWGSDPDQETRLTRLRTDLDAAQHFLALLA
jgi:chaperone required for assembly of F1-ATPase